MEEASSETLAKAVIKPRWQERAKKSVSKERSLSTGDTGTQVALYTRPLCPIPVSVWMNGRTECGNENRHTCTCTHAHTALGGEVGRLAQLIDKLENKV